MTINNLINPDYQHLRSTTQQLYLFGEHISKSKSPLFHNTLFKLLGINWTFQPFETSSIKEIDSKFQNEQLIGSSITMPNKVNAIKIVDELDDIGKGCGSINTIYLKIDPKTNKSLKIGTNTDTVGISQAFLQNYPKECKTNQDKPGLVYGGGGACRSAIYSLYSQLHVSKIYIVNRFKNEVTDIQNEFKLRGFKCEIIHIDSPELAKSVEEPKLVVLTVPNFKPTTSEEIIAKETLDVFMNQSDPGVVLEMCYHPIIETQLYKQFSDANWKVINGVEAMIYQGFAQQVLWTGLKLNELPLGETMKAIYEDIKKDI